MYSIFIHSILSINFIYHFIVQYTHSFCFIIVQFMLSFHDNILNVVMFILLHTSPIGEGYSGNRLSPNTVGGIPRSGTSTQPVLDMVCAGAQRPPADSSSMWFAQVTLDHLLLHPRCDLRRCTATTC